MVEYETIGIVVIVVSAVSFQIKVVNDRLKEEIENAKDTHKTFCLRLTRLEKQIEKISRHLGVF
jgi:hypothetical protein